MESPNFRSPFSLKNKLLRLFYNIFWAIFVNPFPAKSARKWKIFVLRSFGAKIHSTSIIYSNSKIYMPWNLVMKEYSCIANNVIIENPSKVEIGAHSIISQYSYLCTASHDIRNNDFPQFSEPIVLGERCWVCARCFIGPGVNIGDGAVVGAASSVFKNVDSWNIVGGNPSKYIGKRIINS